MGRYRGVRGQAGQIDVCRSSPSPTWEGVLALGPPGALPCFLCGHSGYPDLTALSVVPPRPPLSLCASTGLCTGRTPWTSLWVQSPASAPPLRAPSPKKACCITRRAPRTWAKSTGRVASWCSGGSPRGAGPGPQQGSPQGRPPGREAPGGLLAPPQGFGSTLPSGYESFRVQPAISGAPGSWACHVQAAAKAFTVPRPAEGTAHPPMPLQFLLYLPCHGGQALGLRGFRPQLAGPPGIWAPPGLQSLGHASPLPCCAPAATGSSTSILTALMSPLCSP